MKCGLPAGSFETSWGGIASLSLGLSIFWSEARMRGLTLADVARLMSSAPAALAGLESKGRIAAGCDADLTVFAPHESFAVTPERLHFRHPISPYLGKTLTGVVQQTVLRGQVVFDRGQFPRSQRRPRGALITPPQITCEDAQYALDLCSRIAAHTDVPGTITRTFLSAAAHRVHGLLRDEMQALGMTVRIDSAGNVRGLYPAAANGPILLLGSHVDTVPNAGRYDGILGVTIPLALLRALRGRRFDYAIELIAFSEEEGIRFKMPFIGSRALAGTLGESELGRTDADGVTLAQAIRDFVLNPDTLAEAALTPNTFAFLECHIEQGPILESLGLPLAVVGAIVGQTRHELTFTGHANHAGTTPMPLRRDALAAAARFISAAESHARNTPGLAATVGVIHAAPGAPNIIPGLVACTLDLRHANDGIREAAAAQLFAQAAAECAVRGVTLAIQESNTQASVPLHAALTDALAAAAVRAGHSPHRMNSGAGHDAMILAPHIPRRDALPAYARRAESSPG